LKLLWPQRYTLYELMVQRATMGEVAFEAEHQGNPHDPSLCEWPEHYFTHAAFWFDEWPADAKWACKTVAVDPSKGKDSDHGDPSAIVKFGVTWQGVEYVEADIKLRTVDAICEDAAAHVKAFRPDGLYLEPVAFQELMAAPLRAAMKALGVEATIHLDVDNTAKEVRIRRLTEGLCQRRMRFKSRSPGTQVLVQQLRSFPNGDHDDGPDALEFARRLAIKLLRKGAR
jgi:predicted phage terminase large subunit-like protein